MDCEINLFLRFRIIQPQQIFFSAWPIILVLPTVIISLPLRAGYILAQGKASNLALERLRVRFNPRPAFAHRR
jgi:hypothetical protein